MSTRTRRSRPTRGTGRRILVTGIGGELGWRVASYLEQFEGVGSILGLDVQPPRGRLRRAEFELVQVHETDRLVGIVTDYDPHQVIHLAVWEPHARTGPDTAAERTAAWATTVLGAAAECPSLESIVVRSGIEVYGRGKGAVTRPSERAPLRPTSPYGESMVSLERVADAAGQAAGVAVTSLRLASVIGPHVPSPLGRLLRLQTVPFQLLTDPAFTVVHQHDAADAVVTAAQLGIGGSPYHGAINVVAPGAMTVLQTIRHGNRIPIPVWGVQWTAAKQLAYVRGAPIPPHTEELLRKGRLADNHLAEEVLGFRAHYSALEVIDQLFSWPAVIHLPAERAIA